MTKPKFNRKESSVMYICTYCDYADNVCECEIESNEHTFLKITTTSELCQMTLYEDEFVEVKNE